MLRGSDNHACIVRIRGSRGYLNTAIAYRHLCTHPSMQHAALPASRRERMLPYSQACTANLMSCRMLKRRLTWLKVREMFFLCLRLAKIRLDTSSLALLAYGVTTNAT